MLCHDQGGKNVSKIVAPSVLAMDFSDMKTQLKRIKIGGAEWIHYDVMDGVFVPNISFGPDLMQQIVNHSDAFMDVHLMIQKPIDYFDAFIEKGAQAITFHVECMSSVEEGLSAVKYLHSKNIKAGITLRPGTSLEAIITYLKHVDIVLVMSVEPGFGGQVFIMDMLGRIEHLNKIRRLNNYQYLISVDGGINETTGKLCRTAGSDILIAGSYIFKDEIEKNVKSLL